MLATEPCCDTCTRDGRNEYIQRARFHANEATVYAQRARAHANEAVAHARDAAVHVRRAQRMVIVVAVMAAVALVLTLI